MSVPILVDVGMIGRTPLKSSYTFMWIVLFLCHWSNIVYIKTSTNITNYVLNVDGLRNKMINVNTGRQVGWFVKPFSSENLSHYMVCKSKGFNQGLIWILLLSSIFFSCFPCSSICICKFLWIWFQERGINC